MKRGWTDGGWGKKERGRVACRARCRGPLLGASLLGLLGLLGLPGARVLGILIVNVLAGAP